MRTIGGFAEILTEAYAERLNEEGRDFLRRITCGVGKMQTLIDDMLNLSRIGRQEMKREDTNLSTIVRDYLTETMSIDPGRKAEFIIQENVYANAHPRLIHLALENLLRNAWKFTAHNKLTRIEFGTVSSDKLRQQLSKSEHNFGAVGNPGQTVYFISDNGVGFDSQFAEKIFEPFKRVHAEKEFGGTGVGLSIVQRVIGRHGGKVWGEGEPGKGATFYFTLG